MIRIKQKLVHSLLLALLLALLAVPGVSVGAAGLATSEPQYTTSLRTWPGDMQFIQPECNGGGSSGGNCGGG
jgi:hypothetical protein